MQVSANNLQKKYTGNNIFSGLSLDIPFRSQIAIVGPNGSGKTTLLQILAGFSLPTEGEVIYKLNGDIIDSDLWYSHISFCSPYQELIEEFTASEVAKLHFSLKILSNSLDIGSFLELVSLEKEKNKPIKYYSTGMKQRLKLGLAFCSDTPLLFLDEPTSNLDQFNFNWFQAMINDFGKNRTVMISSNQSNEYSFCEKVIDILNYK